ncbi:MAG: hypothetical protein Kow0075_01080 [Salibacteraceae bacterium]
MAHTAAELEELLSCLEGNVVEVKVKPRSSKSLIEVDASNKRLIAYLRSAPENNRANKELIQLLKKQFKLRATIRSGHKHTTKVIELEPRQRS